MKVAVTYTIIAIIATLANIGGQELVVQLWPFEYLVTLSIFFGTGVGLVVKYLLDKRYIFQFTTDNLSHDAKLFVLYTAMGVITTAIFWGVEWSFHAIYQTKEMRYLGGVIGLAIGYLIKYQLDKRYVFRTA
ncbi:MAG: GtrA family protein [Gammaproteobacteria bacterium]|nr:GtrA family protein [Gammaproteobacteria bacterium]MCW8983189.1 GtrA family protein [Gammaproteobacteria bacterium]